MSDTTPGRKGSELAYQPALDGLRGLAVLAVLLYHGGVSWAGGGFLGVEAFFVLSGFLITSLLLAEWQKDGAVHLGNFWARRARRLLPALFALVIVCAVYESVAGAAHAVPDFGADALATLLYVGNWHQIWTGNGYFAQAALVSPLQHTWSLAIEEQFYLIWPLALIGLLALGRRISGSANSHKRLVPLLVLSVLGALGSAAEMAWLYHDGSGLDRVYYGTDTRAQGLLAGAAFAVVMAMVGSARSSTERRSHGVAAAVAGVAGATGLGVAFVLATGEPSWLFLGGFLAIDAAALCVIWAAVTSCGRFSPIRSVLSMKPLVLVGSISYGLYLWHFPLFLWLTQLSTGLSGAALLWLRLGASFGTAMLSYLLIEQPVRRRRLRGAALRVVTPAVACLALAAVLLAWSAGEAVASTPRTIPVHLASGHQRCAVWVNDKKDIKILHVCPPVKALVVGDSIGLTVGMQISFGEQSYGIILYDKAQLGCGFIDKGTNDETGAGYYPPKPYCLTAFSTWRAEEKAYQAQVIVVEMGYWDELDWTQNGHEVNLGDPSFDRELSRRMDTFVREMSLPGVPIVFLSVPVVDPAAWPDGSPAPQTSPARHQMIDSMLQHLTVKFPKKVYYFNLSPYITPGGKFHLNLGTGICRNPDGIHLYTGTYPYIIQTYCGAHLQRAFIPWLRHLVISRRDR